MAELDLEQQVVAISARLTACGIPHALGGALAYNFYGVPRNTGDIDFNVFLSHEDGARTFACLSALGIDFSDGAAAAQLAREWQTRFSWQGRPIDLFFAYHAFHDSCRDRVHPVLFAGSPIDILSAEDLVVFKVIFNRTRDWADIERVVATQGAAFDLEYALGWLDCILGEDDSRRARLVALRAST